MSEEKKIIKEGKVKEEEKSPKNTPPPRKDASWGYDPKPTTRPTEEGVGW